MSILGVRSSFQVDSYTRGGDKVEVAVDGLSPASSRPLSPPEISQTSLSENAAFSFKTCAVLADMLGATEYIVPASAALVAGLKGFQRRVAERLSGCSTASKNQNRGNSQMKNKLNLLLHKIRLLAEDNEGQDLVEYALLAGFVAVAAGALLPGISDSISVIFSKMASVLSAAAV